MDAENCDPWSVVVKTLAKFGSYEFDTPSSFELPPKFRLFPEFVFNLLKVVRILARALRHMERSVGRATGSEQVIVGKTDRSNLELPDML